MPGFVDHLLDDLVYYTNHMGPRQWGIVVLLIIGVGFACMRGFGSRTNY